MMQSSKRPLPQLFLAHPVLAYLPDPGTPQGAPCAGGFRSTGVAQSTDKSKDKRRGGSGRRSGGFSCRSEPSPTPPLAVGGGDLSCPERKEPGDHPRAISVTRGGDLSCPERKEPDTRGNDREASIGCAARDVGRPTSDVAPDATPTAGRSFYGPSEKGFGP